MRAPEFAIGGSVADFDRVFQQGRHNSRLMAIRSIANAGPTTPFRFAPSPNEWGTRWYATRSASLTGGTALPLTEKVRRGESPVRPPAANCSVLHAEDKLTVLLKALACPGRAGLMARKPSLFAIRIYQRAISPGLSLRCRFEPFINRTTPTKPSDVFASTPGVRSWVYAGFCAVGPWAAGATIRSN